MQKITYYPIFRMELGMNNPVYIEIQVMILNIVWIRFTGVNLNFDVVNFNNLLLNYVNNNHKVFLRQPPIEHQHSHYISNLKSLLSRLI